MHRLAWSLDACLKDRVLDEKRMRELHQFFVPLNKPAASTGSCEPLHCSDLLSAMLFNVCQCLLGILDRYIIESQSHPGRMAKHPDSNGLMCIVQIRHSIKRNTWTILT